MFGEEFHKTKTDEAVREAEQEAAQRQRERALMESNDPANQSGAIAREDLNGDNTPRELSPEEEEKIQLYIDEDEASRISSGRPTLTEEEKLHIRADIIAAIDSEKSVAPLANHHSSSNHSIEEAMAAIKHLSSRSTSSEETSSQPSTPPESSRKISGDSSSSDGRHTRLYSQGSHSNGSTSGEDSHHTTPEKRIPSTSLLPAMTEVERLQEEARRVKAELDHVRQVHHDTKQSREAVCQELTDACVRIFCNENWWRRAGAGNVTRAAQGETISLTVSEQKVLPFFQEKERLNAITKVHSKERIEQLHNHYLAIHEKLKSIDPSPSGKLSSIQVLVDSIIESIREGAEWDLIRCISVLPFKEEPPQKKAFLSTLWKQYYSLVQERHQIRKSSAPSTPYVPSESERRELQSLQEDLVAAKREMNLHQTTRDQLQEQFNRHQQNVTRLQQQVDDFKRGKLFYNFSDQLAELRSQRDAAVLAKNRFIASTTNQFETAKRAIETHLQKIKELTLQSNHLTENLSLHPEQRFTQAEADYLNPTTFQRLLNSYLEIIQQVGQYCKDAHEASKSFKNSYGDIPRCGPYGGPEKYWAPIYEEKADRSIKAAIRSAQELAKIRFALFAPQEQQIEQRRLASLSKSQRDKEILHLLGRYSYEPNYQEGIPLERFGWAQVRKSALEDRARDIAYRNQGHAELGIFQHTIPPASSYSNPSSYNAGMRSFNAFQLASQQQFTYQQGMNNAYYNIGQVTFANQAAAMRTPR